MASYTHGGWPEGDLMETRGLEELRAQMSGWLHFWEQFAIEAEEFLEAGDRIGVLVRWTGRGKLTGALMEGEGAHLWTFRDGKATRFDLYVDRDEALKALRG